MLNILCRSDTFRSEFVMTWFVYHEVMGAFTQPLRRLPSFFCPELNHKLLLIDMNMVRQATSFWCRKANCYLLC